MIAILVPGQTREEPCIHVDAYFADRTDHLMRHLATALLFTLSFAAVPSVVNAQIAHDLAVYSEDGDKFTLYVNGEQINAEPGANVKVENTNNDYVLVKIVFADTSITAIERKNLQIAEPGVNAKGPVSVVYKVKLNKKGEHVLSFVSRSAKKIQEGPTIIINN